MNRYHLHGIEVILTPAVSERRTEEALDLAEEFIRWRFARPVRISTDGRDGTLHRVGLMSPHDARRASQDALPARKVSRGGLTGEIFGMYGFDVNDMTAEDLADAVSLWTEPVCIDVDQDGMLYVTD